MTTHPTRSQSREAGGAPPTETTRRRLGQATDGGQETLRSQQPARQPVKALSPIVHQVVDGFMDSLQSTGEGVLPIVLVLQPELSTSGVAESDAEFARRERRQTAAERRFFRTIEAALRGAMETVLSRAAYAAITGDAGPSRRREIKDRTVMAAGGRTSPRKAHLQLPVPLALDAE